jgi:hypothetical protein
MKTLIILMILFLTAGACFAQKGSTSGYRVRAGKSNITVTYKGKSHMIKAGDYIDAAKVTSSKILFVSHIDKFTYLLIDVTGQSKAVGDMHECGAGMESNLIRIKLSPAWKVTEMDGVLYDSCWSSVVSEDGYSIKGNILNVEYDNIREKENTRLEYDANNPEGAFKIEKKKIEDN